MSTPSQETEAFRENIADVLERECGSRTLHDFVIDYKGDPK